MAMPVAFLAGTTYSSYINNKIATGKTIFNNSMPPMPVAMPIRKSLSCNPHPLNPHPLNPHPNNQHPNNAHQNNASSTLNASSWCNWLATDTTPDSRQTTSEQTPGHFFIQKTNTAARNRRFLIHIITALHPSRAGIQIAYWLGQVLIKVALPTNLYFLVAL